MAYVVVLFTGSECEEHSGKPCVMEVLGPYDRKESEQVVKLYLEQAPWTAPHRVELSGKGVL